MAYLCALAAVIVATLLRLAIQPLVGNAIPFLTYFAAALLIAWHFGWWPAALCVALSILPGTYFFLNPGATLSLASDVAARAPVGGFMVAALGASYLLATVRKALRRARAAEQEQRRINQELIETNRDLEAFAFAASHDLREPLRTITTYSQLLTEAARGQSLIETGTAARVIIEATARMGHFLDDLLVYTRLNADTEEHAPEKVDLNVALAHAMQNLETAIRQTKALVSSSQLPFVSGHEVHFVQLFQNLIENAIKYSGERTPDIRITAERFGGEWRVAVRDNGIGIEAKYREQIFEVFKRLHGRQLPGTGIGLAICRRVVEGCGGRIWVESEPGRGSTFYFSLPWVEETVKTIAVAQTAD